MPMLARRRAAAPKMVSRSMLKSWRAVEWMTTSSMGRTRATGNPLLAWRSCSVMALASWCGSDSVRTIQATGTMLRVEGGHAVGDLGLRARS